METLIAENKPLICELTPEGVQNAVAAHGEVESLRPAYMHARLYGSLDVVRLIGGISYGQIKRWLELGLFKPEAQQANGKGSRRFFTAKNLVEVQIVASLFDAGLEAEQIGLALRALVDKAYFERLALPAHQRKSDPIALLLFDKKYFAVATQANLHLIYADSMNKYRSVVTLNLMGVERCIQESVEKMVTGAT